MLFIESRITDRTVDPASRVAFLERMQEGGLVPLIRSARLYCYEQALLGPERAKELERLVAARTAEERGEPYVPGDVFCFEDFAHFLVFEDADGESPVTRAGIVYDTETFDPSQKLEAFCRNVEAAMKAVSAAARGGGGASFEEASEGVVWRERGTERRAGSAHDSADAHGAGTAAAQTPARGAEAAERSRAVEILGDAQARRFLQRLSEAHADNRLAEMLAGGIAQDPAAEALVPRLAGAGLVKREVLVSCRKDGRSLFRLPSPDALAIVTSSYAVCSECGAAVADERAEELIAPTPLASSLLKDGAWLASSLRGVLVELGIPEARIAAPAAPSGAEAQLLAEVGGERFLFLLHDGDFSAAQARRALDTEAEREASHLVVVATGKIQDEARARLREHARRRARGGGGLEVIVVEGTEAAAAELRHALDRVSQKALAGELYELDASTGFNVGHMIAARFRLRQKTGALKDLAASAAGALAGSLREI